MNDIDHEHIYRNGIDNQGEYYKCECGHKVREDVPVVSDVDRKIDKILHDVYLAGWNDKLCDDSPTFVPVEHLTKLYAKQAITSLIKELVAEARIDGAIMGAKFGNAAFRQYNVAGKPMNLDEIRDVGIKQAEDWAKRQC